MFKFTILLVLLSGQASVEQKEFSNLWICEKYAKQMVQYHRGTERYQKVDAKCFLEVTA